MNTKVVHYDMILNGNAETSKALLAFIVSFCVIKFCPLSLFWTKIYNPDIRTVFLGKCSEQTPQYCQVSF